MITCVLRHIQPLMISRDDVRANVMTVKQEDREVFEALACDSFVAKSRKSSSNFFDTTQWTQTKPSYDNVTSDPPFLPPHLSQNVLNKTTSFQTDPALLPEPISHVMFQHLYAQSIKDHLLVLASTTRYKKKCVTIVYYTTIE